MLCNVLIEYLVIEFKGILLSQLIIELPTMRLDNVTLSRGRAIGKRVVSSLDIACHYFFVVRSAIFQRDQSLGRRRMFLITWAFSIKLSHNLIESISVSVLPIVEHLREKLIELRLDIISFLF